MNKYTPLQIQNMLDSLVILVDTREQETKSLQRRLEGLNRPFERQKLNVGDYSGKYQDISGEWLEMAQIAIVERKMSIDELAFCFTGERERFKREFERAKADGCRMHLLIESGNYEKIYTHNYRSKLAPQSLIASLFSWSNRYNIQLHFCKPEISGWLIGEILHYSLREFLINQ